MLINPSYIFSNAMTELLSREKEFHKLNDQLNKLTASDKKEQYNSQEQQQSSHQPSSYQNGGVTKMTTMTAGHHVNGGGGGGGPVGAGAVPKQERYHTYTKTKGQSTFLKKRGAGDGGVEPLPQTLPTTTNPTSPQTTTNYNNIITKERHYNTVTTHTKDYNRQGRYNNSNNNNNNNSNNTNKSQQQSYRYGSTAATPTTARNNNNNNNNSNNNNSNNNNARNGTCSPDGDSRKYNSSSEKSSIQSSNKNRPKSVKPHESSTRSYQSRTSSNRVNGPLVGFTVKYRNPKFVESPSLEFLIKEEVNSINVNDPMMNVNEFHSIDMENIDKYNPETKHMSTEGVIKFLKSKIKILEEDHDRITVEMNQQRELLEKTLERSKKVEQQRDQAIAKSNALTEQLSKTELQLEETNRRNKDRQLEFATHMKELEIAKRDLKLLSQTNTNLEKRLYRATEELENAKNTLALMKTSEREMKESMRVECEGRDKQVKSLKKQRADLLNAYKKQLFLIDNLKRQNICMEQSKMIGFGEKEFTKVLEWNTK